MPFFDKYPYTNFHNVNLDWVLERVKEWGALVEQNNTAFHDLEEANEDFKNYVTNYIENLDYQGAIDDKLDRMFESGVLGEYLQPYVSPVVSTWLDENITQPTGVVIDSSLTVAGACADAKAVGDKISLLDNKLNINGFTPEAKSALLACIRNFAWTIENGQQYYNTLATALSGVLWDYEWYSSSGIAPSGMTGTFDFNTSDESLKVICPNLVLNHNSKFEFIIECKFALFEGFNTPMLSVADSNNGMGFALYVRSNNNTEATAQKNKISTQINYDASTKVFTNIVQSEYHVYRLINESMNTFFYVDGTLINSWNWTNTSDMTGGNNNVKIVTANTTTVYMNIKSIKFRNII